MKYYMRSRNNKYAPIDENSTKNPINNIIKEIPIENKLKETLDVKILCPPSSIYDTINPLLSTDKPCHCTNPDQTYSNKWVHINGKC